MAEALAAMGMAGGAGAAMPSGMATAGGMASGVGMAGSAGAGASTLPSVMGSMGNAAALGGASTLGGTLASRLMGPSGQTITPQRLIGGNFTIRGQNPISALPAPVPAVGGGANTFAGQPGGLQALLQALRGGQ
jgi:hypothetical protein